LPPAHHAGAGQAIWRLYRHHGISRAAAFTSSSTKKVCANGRWVGEPGRIDDYIVEQAFALHKTLDNANEVAADSATDAAVVHLEHFFIRADNKFVVDTDLAEFVDHDRVTLAVRLA